MTLEQLKMLVAIADSGGILAAAEALHKTQPTVSIAIRKLEDELGLQILSRESYRASLTSAGETLCQQARTILKQSKILCGMAQHLAQGNEPEINIAIEASCPLPLILGTLGNCESKFPGTQFNLMGDTLWGALERLRLGEADLAISPWFEENLMYESFQLISATLVTVASPQFRNKLGAEALELDDLNDSVQVVVRDSSRNPPQRSFGYLPEGRHWYVTDHLTKKEIILAGMGWGRLHKHMIKDELRSGKLIPLSIRHYATTMEVKICVARIMDKPVGPVAATLWEEFAQISNAPY
jgi:DNA-binding transcriptional LysR family regulator